MLRTIFVPIVVLCHIVTKSSAISESGFKNVESYITELATTS